MIIPTSLTTRRSAFVFLLRRLCCSENEIKRDDTGGRVSAHRQDTDKKTDHCRGNGQFFIWLYPVQAAAGSSSSSCAAIHSAVRIATLSFRFVKKNRLSYT